MLKRITINRHEIRNSAMMLGKTQVNVLWSVGAVGRTNVSPASSPSFRLFVFANTKKLSELELVPTHWIVRTNCIVQIGSTLKFGVSYPSNSMLCFFLFNHFDAQQATASWKKNIAELSNDFYRGVSASPVGVLAYLIIIDSKTILQDLERGIELRTSWRRDNLGLELLVESFWWPMLRNDPKALIDWLSYR